MESGCFNKGKIHILRIDPGEDVLVSVRKFLCDRKIAQAIVLGGYGTLSEYHLHWVTRGTLPSRNAFGKGKGGIEILGMNGLIVGGEPHIHVSLSTRKGAFGGHMEDGCRAYVVCEIFFLELKGRKLTRKSTPVNIPGMGRGQVQRLIFGKEKP
ncbi:MAG: hypothetical protein A2X48_17055 [Lentisphaerae bacterium GWF2_49_21]|nr:MAG: hypothetical protein A2X48_17055 [Lentisphaerae bacterium GWF2_49_21]